MYEKYSKGTLLYSITHFIIIFTSFLQNLVFTRVIDQAQLGVYALSYSVVNFFVVISSLGLWSGIPILAIKDQKKGLFRNLVTFRLITLSLFISALFFISDYLGYLYNSLLLRDLLKICCIFLFGTSFSEFIIKILLSKEEFNLSSILLIIGDISALFFTVTLVLSNNSAINIYIGLIIALLIKNVLSFILGFKFLSEKSDSSQLDDIKSVLKISLPSYSHSVQMFLFDALVPLLIGLFFTEIDVALFFYAFNFTNFLLFFNFPLKTIGVTAFANLNNDRQQFYVFKMFKFISICCIPICFLIISFSNQITSLIYGPLYLNSGYILDFLTFFVIFRYYNSLFLVYYLDQKNKILNGIYRGISLAIFIFSMYLATQIFYNVFSIILSFIFGEICMSFFYIGTFLKETKSFKNIIKSKTPYILSFLFIFYTGTVFILKFLINLTQMEFLIIIGVLTLLYPILISLTRVLNTEEFEILEKVIKPLRFISVPLLYLLKIIKKISLRN